MFKLTVCAFQIVVMMLMLMLIMMIMTVMVMTVTKHIPTNHIPTRWESVIMLKVGNIKHFPTIPIYNDNDKYNDGGWGVWSD